MTSRAGLPTAGRPEGRSPCAGSAGRAAPGKTRLALLAMALGAAGCGDNGSGRFIEVHGVWADGEVIAFHQRADFYPAREGQPRTILVAEDFNRGRLLGIKLAYDPAVVATPGTYIAGAENAPVELSVLRPLDERDSVEYPMNAASLTFGTLPVGGQPLAGTIGAARLERQGMLYLTFDSGSFRGN